SATEINLHRHVCIMLIGLLFLGTGNEAPAWSSPGHNAIGMLAIERLQDDTRKRLADIVGPLNSTAISTACNWPDVIRDEDAWEWSKPLHYINIPRGNFSYRATRDCPDGLCATEAIKHYAAELANASNDREQRWQAFAWLCHLVADLHQPMHAGFADDRGGNDFEFTFDDETINLHYFWDRVLVEQHAGDWESLLKLLQSAPAPVLEPGWKPADVDGWTNESHALAVDAAYPPEEGINAAWEQQTWKIAFERINLAAARLALVIETLLTD
ncbi:MAG: S1/P1 nuclease, partial [Xanthomonadales bacterium]|nr:S1/P1 nuclease [Xanthomonadales bacterium]